jgi:CubicO group peptidase (beta-lactamase class C family)
MDFASISSVVSQHLGKTFPAAQIAIRLRGQVVYVNAFGWLDPDTQSRITNHESRFDFASVSKLFTVAAFMTFVEQGRVALDQRVCELLPEFVGARAIEPYPDPLKTGAVVQVVPMTNARADASQVTFRNLLAHNAGLPAWLPLWKLPAREARRATALTCAFAYPTGARVVYSDIGLILIGFALEALGGKSLDAIVRERVTAPLGLDSIGYGPIPPDNTAPTEFYAHQNRRLCGEVHDENAWSLGGVAGHAGIFGNARDLAVFGEALRTNRLLKRATLAEMTRVQAHDGALRRGIGFVLWSPDPLASGNPLSEQSFGHTGFTGTSLWIDPARELVIACLTNRVYYGRGNADAIMQFRVALHRTIVGILDATSRGTIN